MAFIGNTSGTLDYDFAQRLLHALGPSSIGIAINDRRLRLQAINHSLMRSNGLPLAEQLGKPVHHVLGGAIHVVGPQLERVFSTGQPIYGFELSAKLPGRQSVGHWVEDYLPVVDDRGKVTHICAMVLETTKQHADDRWCDGNRGKAAEHKMDTCRTSPNRCYSWNVSEWAASSDGNMHGMKVDPRSHRRLEAARIRIRRAHPHASGAIGSAARISEREREVLRLLANGQSNKQVASELSISVRTVETHRARIFQKLHLDSVVGLVHYAIRHNIVEA
jgi:DNA-binding CsgD family transcriptional regulator